MSRRNRKSHKLRNVLVLLVILAFIISAVAVAYQLNKRPPALVVHVASSPAIIERDGTSVVTIHVSESSTGKPVQSANVTVTASAGPMNPASGPTDTNGDFRTTYTAPPQIGIVSINAEASLSNHDPGHGASAVSVVTDKVLLVTSMGNITIELYEDMPITSGNFANLTLHGVYDGTIFHRVVHDFVVQGGDTSAKNITVPSIPDELPNRHSNIRGSVAMAKTDQLNSATSQFYINLKNNTRVPTNLDTKYSVFGKVVAGMDAVDKIGNVATDSNDKPLQDVNLVSAQIIE
jgi:peptidylprolyl isomerase